MREGIILHGLRVTSSDGGFEGAVKQFAIIVVMKGLPFLRGANFFV